MKSYLRILTATSLCIGLFSGHAIAETSAVESKAKEVGYKTCIDDLADTANLVIRDHQHSALSTWNSGSPNSHLFNSQVVVKYSDGYSLGLINSVPNKEGKCDGAYSTVFTSEKSCTIVREETYKDFAYKAEMAGLLLLENKSKSKNVILMPSGTGCVAVGTEVYYDMVVKK